MSNSLNILEIALYSYCKNDPVNEKDVSGNLLASKIAEIILSVLASVLLQLGSDLITYVIKKYILNRNVDFNPNPKDYILAAIGGALDCINPFSKGKNAKKIYSIVCPLIFVIVDHVWTFISEKKFDIKKVGYDLIKSLVNGIIVIVLDKKKKSEIKNIKKKNKKRTNEFKNKRIAVNAKFKILGKKIELAFEISEYITDILFGAILSN